MTDAATLLLAFIIGASLWEISRLLAAIAVLGWLYTQRDRRAW